jgi:AcrR family transcriptional regulator
MPKHATAAPGRPRSEHARRAVLAAATTLFEKGGYAAATVESIAAKSGVAKTTIYRWWPNRAALLVELLMEVARAAAPPPEGRDPVAALRTELRRAGVAVHGLSGRLVTALLGEAQQDPELRAALVRGLFHPRTAASAAVVRRAQGSGAVRPDVSPDVAVDLLFGPMFYRLLVQHRPVTDAFVREVFDSVMEGLRPRRARRRARAASRVIS